MPHLSSDNLTSPNGTWASSPFSAAHFFRPHQSERGGDRFHLVRVEDNLFFYLADATGHGEKGATFWERHGSSFDDRWEALTRSEGREEDFRTFAQRVNDDLTRSGDRSAQLCLSLGKLSPQGDLFFANLGYGTHVLPTTVDGPWWTEPTALVSLKLGWISSPTWEGLPRHWMVHTVEGIRRVVMISDGFLGDDHARPVETMDDLKQLHRHLAAVPLTEVYPMLSEHSPVADDDQTMVVVEIG